MALSKRITFSTTPAKFTIYRCHPQFIEDDRLHRKPFSPVYTFSFELAEFHIDIGDFENSSLHSEHFLKARQTGLVEEFYTKFVRYNSKLIEKQFEAELINLKKSFLREKEALESFEDIPALRVEVATLGRILESYFPLLREMSLERLPVYEAQNKDIPLERLHHFKKLFLTVYFPRLELDVQYS